MQQSQHKIVVLAAGGHAKVVVNLLQAANIDINGCIDPYGHHQQTHLLHVPIFNLPDDQLPKKFPGDQFALANGLGFNPKFAGRRQEVYEYFVAQGYHFPVLRHPMSIIANEVIFDYGVQLHAGAIVQPGVSIGANTVINTGAIIEHDCLIKEHAHIAPGAILCGGVIVGNGATIGAGATILPGCNIGDGAIIGAGAVVTKNVARSAVVTGNPARSVAVD